MNKQKPKVSVIVPIYNVEKYVEKCIQTICNQSYDNLEIILVDDGSPDEAGLICDRYAEIDGRIRVIHKINDGVSEARNSGLKIATGEYVCFVDGDDYLAADYVEYMLDMICLNDADIALTTDTFTNYQTEQIKKDVISICTGEDVTEGILCYRIPIGVYCKIFRRSFLGENIRFLKELFIGEGFNFNTTAFQYAQKVVVGHRRTYFYRLDNPTSATTKFSIEKWENGLYAIDLIKKNLMIKSERIEKAWKFARWHTCADVYNLMVMADVEEQYPSMYNRCLKVLKTQAFYAFKVPCSVKERMKAIVYMICPSLIPKLKILRRRKYHVNINN